jgi:hypothetical protein
MGGQMANAFQPGAPGGYPQGAGAPPPAAVPVAAAPAGAGDLVERIKKLDALKAAGVLSEDEYAKKKAEIIASI